MDHRIGKILVETEQFEQVAVDRISLIERKTVTIIHRLSIIVTIRYIDYEICVV